ncbi:MAG TPA: UvrD-helicase domain-containing protein [Candidatus Binatia bacterium]|nr:UvrD-helicase domain-containing protein [Candidatus Binatia bacterium]
MSEAQAHIELPDARDRQVAVGTFDRNLVVTAGAGTGKTTLLVDRLVHLLLRSPEPLKITEIVALTFTNKAADEMRLRLRQRLQGFLDIELDRRAKNDAEEKTQKDIEALMGLYQLSKDELDSRVRDALRNMERGDIGTIHSFAATLLRLYPLEAGVDPEFHEDDGAAFERLFNEHWDLWLDQELSLRNAHAENWRKILARCQLDHIKALAKSIAVENVDLKQSSNGVNAIPPVLREWLAKLEGKAASLSARHPEDRLNERLVRAAREILGECGKTGRGSDASKETSDLLAEKAINRSTDGWSADDVSEAQELVRAARGLLRIDGELTGLLWRLLVPYAEDFRERFVREGHLSFDGLLVRARNLVRDQPRVRAELKRRYRAILIDEFQDTDPIQYEILLYLAEQPSQAAMDWRQVKLVPGKIFVVGDPKQSIYAFRRADIEAYLEVVEKIIKAQNGVECRLTTNFRSNKEILEVVNGAFQTLIQAQDGVQPPYIAIHPAPGRIAAASQVPKLLVRKIVADKEEIDAETARRLEGESLACWLNEQVLGKIAILNARGEHIYAQPKDVAILLRKLTDIHDYLEPLRRQGIRYVVEGERHFYATKEIIDAVNLLRVVDNPHDRMALVGVLRSPLGGLTDQQIYELHRQNLLDYRAAAKLTGKDFPPPLTDLYDALARLHNEIRTMPIGAAVAHVFAALPVDLLAACYFHGEQAVANLQKLAQQAELLGREGLTTIKEAIRQLEQRVLDVKEEGESVLAEENLDAVRIMSIHKSKGLEFPIVILAGCQTGAEGSRGLDAEAMFDWSTGLTGLRIGSISDLAGLYIAEKSRLRSAEEQKRLLYVAMTRAREHLVVSCAPSGRRANGSFLSMLDDTLDDSIADTEASTSISLGAGVVDIEVISEKLTAPGRKKGKSRPTKQKSQWESFVDIWTSRDKKYHAARSVPFVTPTLLKRQEESSTEAGCRTNGQGHRQTPALIVGDLAHRFLQHWQFSSNVKEFPRQLNKFITHSLPGEFQSSSTKIEGELKEIFTSFFRSKIYADLASSRILGREVPLLIPWNDQIMEGVIDLIYEQNGLLYLADYKTDKVDKKNLTEAALPYRQQAEIYSQAVKQSLGREPAGFKIIFLRLGETVEVGTVKNRQLALF